MAEGEACPLPSVRHASMDAQIVARLLGARRIAVVGVSDNAARPAFEIAQYLIDIGKEVYPVNPRFTALLGRTCYPTVALIPARVELVNVFRRAEYCPGVVEDAVAARAGAVWLQSGIVSAEARNLAANAGMDYVENRCLKVEHMFRRSQ